LMAAGPAKGVMRSAGRTGGSPSSGGSGVSRAPKAAPLPEGPIRRGIRIEDQMAQADYKDWFRVGTLDGGKFPLVDFQKGQTLVSVKTANTSGTGWLRAMHEHIRDLGTRGATINGQPANMVLDLRVQPGGTAAAQPLVDLGRRLGVRVIVKEW